jgi:tetratricopeptide (TPR) repeat protein
MAVAGAVELMAGDPERARDFFEQVLPSWQGRRLSPFSDAGVETYLAALLLRSGRHGEATRLLAKSLAADRQSLKSGNQDWSGPFDMACVHALRGEKDQAFHSLERAIEAGWRGMPVGTRTPLLDPLRGDERFRQVEARLATLIAEMRHRAGLS